MGTISSVLNLLAGDSLDESLGAVYCCKSEAVAEPKKRIKDAINAYMAAFSADESCEIAAFSAPGRTELGGNHTDHQRGCVLAAGVNMDMLAVAAKNGTDKILIRSEGYSQLEIDTRELEVCNGEKGSSAALVRGVAAQIKELGYVPAGFNAYICSNVPAGSGLSSSAAFEVLIGTILNYLFCHSDISAEKIAQIGQAAENKYFGKPCGLMDQMASAVGGIVEIDFKNSQSPAVSKIQFDFERADHALCIINSGADHADLTEEYAAITREMTAVAREFGKKVLREVDEGKFFTAIPQLRRALGDRAVLRAMHFFQENKRAQDEAKALKDNDFNKFLTLIRESGSSSQTKLQNSFSIKTPQHQAIPIAIATAERLLEGTGAVRVHGGGFAGTIQAFVPVEMLDGFKAGMEALLGENMCHVLSIRPVGACVIIK